MEVYIDHFKWQDLPVPENSTLEEPTTAMETPEIVTSDTNIEKLTQYIHIYIIKLYFTMDQMKHQWHNPSTGA